MKMVPYQLIILSLIKQELNPKYGPMATAMYKEWYMMLQQEHFGVMNMDQKAAMKSISKKKAKTMDGPLLPTVLITMAALYRIKKKKKALPLLSMYGYLPLHHVAWQ